MADVDPAVGPRPVRRPEAVIDLRSEPPIRRRQTRGAPRESDAHLRAYRDRPVRPSPHGTNRRGRPLEVTLPPDDDPVVTLAPPAEGRVRAREHERVAVPQDERGSVTGPDGDSTPATPGAPRPTRGDLIVRRVRLRSVAKVALTFYLCLWAVVAVAGSILWSLASREGWVAGWTGFLIDVGFSDAAVDGPTLLRASTTAGAITVVTATALTVAAAVFYNQLSGLIGGIEVTLMAPRRPRRRPAA